MKKTAADKALPLDARQAFLRRLPSLRAKKTPPAKPWQESIGSIKDDPLCDEAAKLGAEWRRGMNCTEHG
jgi:hypothetical protein